MNKLKNLHPMVFLHCYIVTTRPQGMEPVEMESNYIFMMILKMNKQYEVYLKKSQVVWVNFII